MSDRVWLPHDTLVFVQADTGGTKGENTLFKVVEDGSTIEYPTVKVKDLAVVQEDQLKGNIFFLLSIRLPDCY